MIDIATLAKQSGIAAHTLRYYDSRGLITAVSRSGLKRVYADGVWLNLRLIHLGQKVGMSLQQIDAAFGLSSHIAVQRETFNQQAQAVAEQIRHLQTMQALLQHLSACAHAQHLDCPEFQALLNEVLPQQQ